MTCSARLLPLLAVLLVLPISCAREDPDTRLPGIRLADLRKQVEFLASDQQEGREVGGEGIARAEEHIARYFAASGLKPLPGQHGFFQEFLLYRTALPEQSTTLTLQTPGGELRGTVGKDFRPFDFTGSGELSAPVVFAGYGITAPEYGYDDYRGLEVRGSFVLVLRHEPGNADPRSLFAGTANTAHAFFRAKAENARRRGAVGMLLVDDPLGSGREEDLSLQVSYSFQAPAPTSLGADFLAAHLSRELVGKLLRGGESLLRLQEAVDAGRRPASLPLAEVSAGLRIPLPETRRTQARNVIGFLEGRDPALRGEWILIGAHHDHIGFTDAEGDWIYNGADDNASGVAGVLALSRLFTRSGAWQEPKAAARPGPGLQPPARPPALPGWTPLQRPRPAPRRSLVFATFSAEEEGLLGSQVLARELAGLPSVHLGRMLNLDMIGRNPAEPVQVLTDDPQGEVRRIVEAASAAPPALPAPRLSSGRGEMASDHGAFFRQGIPYLFFFTGLHPDYHGVDDEAERLSYPRLAEVVRLAWRVASLLADAPR
jgi:hypothetical protein